MKKAALAASTEKAVCLAFEPQASFTDLRRSHPEPLAGLPVDVGDGNMLSILPVIAGKRKTHFPLDRYQNRPCNALPKHG